MRKRFRFAFCPIVRQKYHNTQLRRGCAFFLHPRLLSALLLSLPLHFAAVPFLERTTLREGIGRSRKGGPSSPLPGVPVSARRLLVGDPAAAAQHRLLFVRRQRFKIGAHPRVKPVRRLHLASPRYQCLPASPVYSHQNKLPLFVKKARCSGRSPAARAARFVFLLLASPHRRPAAHSSTIRLQTALV